MGKHLKKYLRLCIYTKSKGTDGYVIINAQFLKCSFLPTREVKMLQNIKSFVYVVQYKIFYFQGIITSLYIYIGINTLVYVYSPSL